MKDKIIEKQDEYIRFLLDHVTFNVVGMQKRDKLKNELAALKSQDEQVYPESFVEWLREYCQSLPYPNEVSHNHWVVWFGGERIYFATTADVYEYWLTNVKGK